MSEVINGVLVYILHESLDVGFGNFEVGQFIYGVFVYGFSYSGCDGDSKVV